MSIRRYKHVYRRVSLLFFSLLFLVGCGGQLEPATNNVSQSTLRPAAFTSALIAQHSQKCAELPGGSTRPGKQLIQWDCNWGQTKQQFSFHPVAGQADTYNLQNVNSELCVSISPQKSYGGNPTVEQRACNEASTRQQFTLSAVANTGKTFQLVAGHSGKCIDVHRGSKENRTLLIEYTCHEDPNQQWRMPGYPTADTPTPPPTTPDAPDTFTASLVASHSGKCADVSRASQDPGAPLIQWPCHGEAQQRFTFSQVGEGSTYVVKNVNSGLCLEFRWRGVTQETCQDIDIQRVTVTPLANDFVQLEIGTDDGTCLDVGSGSTADRATLKRRSCDNAKSQQWRLEQGETTPPTTPTPPPPSGNSVAPIDWSSFTNSKPGDANAVRLERIVNNANRFMLTTWWRDKGYNQSGSYLNFGGTTEHYIRHPGAAAVGLAVALKTGIYDPGSTGVPTGTAKAKTLKLIRSLAHHHKANREGGWGYTWQSALWAHKAGFAAWLLWDDLAEKDRQKVKKMVESEADRLMDYRVPYYRDAAGNIIKSGDTKAEENAWNASILHLASVMMPGHENRARWDAKNVELKVSAYATPSDLSSRENFHGRPLKDWLNGSNAYNDGVVLNHNQVHPDYMAAIEHHLEGALVSSLARQATPKAALIHVDTTYEALIERSFPEGYTHPDTTRPARAPGGTMYVPGSADLYYPHGNGWGTDRIIPYVLLDALVGSFDLDGRVNRKADYWENLHAQKLLEQQSRHRDGRTYATAREDTYKGREAYVNEFAALAYLSKWVTHQGAFSVSNEDYWNR